MAVVVHIHGQEWKGGKWGYLARLGFRGAEWPAVYAPDEVVVLSDELRAYYQHRFGRVATRIPNGVNPPTVAPSSERGEHLTGFKVGTYLLFVGRLVPEKGLEYLLEARARMAAPLPLAIAGEEVHSREYAERLKASWASEQVRFLGGVYGDDLSHLYFNCRALVQPSIREGMSMTLLEAMAHGCRVIASDIGANREALGECAVFVPARSIGPLRQALERLVAEPGSFEALGAAARRRAVAEFQWDAIVDRWEEVYARVARATPGSALVGRPACQ